MNRIVLDRLAPRPQLPPYQEISHPAIRDAAAAWSAAKANLAQARQDVLKLEETRPSTEWATAEVIEQARGAGKPDPKGSPMSEHDKKIAAAQLEEKVAILAEQRAFDGLQVALDAHLADWAADATHEIEALGEVWTAAVQTIAGLHSKLATAHRVRTIATGEIGPITGAIRIGPRDVQGLDFAPAPEGR